MAAPNWTIPPCSTERLLWVAFCSHRIEIFCAKRTVVKKRTSGFAGVLYAHQLRVTIGDCVHDLELIAKETEPTEWSNRLEYLPLKYPGKEFPI